ncbi:peptidyl-prolyl cis-trans isomerase [Paenibacillus filicis]|uniref:Peptidyl-prolyl cis-trans isomerase n=1 Tax=Paenibacillus gyeongsangnamensis TaxID=3388067 RepID=A0ABT4Q2E5_9BACL|nr:peptidyl-prolyl cis-trans isomerase [Paenibacillus filicis]MCZ8510981.1 peptidyl-prolyl cis-trans isomerase [Paenibacillus filicis]
MKRQKRKKWIVFGILCFIFIATFLAAVLKAPRSQDSSDIALINGEPINEREFQMVLQEQKAGVLQYFHDTYHITVNGQSWTTPINGEIPIDVAKTRAMKAMIGIKMQQILMKTEGITDNISYSHFLSQLEKENARRKATVAAGKPIYGPQVFDASTYYPYLFSNQVIALKQKLVAKEWHASDEQLQDYYNSVKEKAFRIADNVSVQQLTIDYGGNSAENFGDKAEDLKSALSKLEQDPTNGDKMDRAEAYAKKVGWSVKQDEEVYTVQDMRGLSEENYGLAEAVSTLKPGKISQPIFFGTAAHIIKVLDRKAMGYQNFNEVKDNVRQRYVDTQYAGLVDQLSGQAKVVLNRKLYDRLQMQ